MKRVRPERKHRDRFERRQQFCKENNCMNPRPKGSARCREHCRGYEEHTKAKDTKARRLSDMADSTLYTKRTMYGVRAFPKDKFGIIQGNAGLS